MVWATVMLLMPQNTQAQCSENESILEILILTDSWPGEVAVEIKDECTGEILGSFGYGTLTEPFALYDFYICLDPAGNYSFTIYDDFGDGICCFEGEGSYTLFYNGVEIQRGGDYGSSETTFFGSGDECPFIPAPENDLCADGIAITCGSIVSGSTRNSTFDNVGTCGTSNTTGGVWYKFVGTGQGVTASTCDFANFDTKLSVFEGSCEGISCVGGNDDDCPGFRSAVSWTSQLGATYYILVHGFGAAQGEFELAIECCDGPANDNICDAQSLTIGVLTPFDNTCATVEAGEMSPGPGSSCTSQDGWCPFEAELQNTVWFKFTAPSTGAVTIRSAFDDAPFDTQLALWESSNGCNGPLTLVAANDDSPNAGFSDFSSEILPVYCLSESKTYYVQVDGFAGVQGTGTVIVEEVPNAKVIICHVRPKNRNNTLEVSICALPAFLAQGAYLGPCNQQRWGDFITDEEHFFEQIGEPMLTAYPNPFSSKTNIEFVLPQGAENASLKVYSLTGQEIADLYKGSVNVQEKISVEFAPTAALGALYLYVLQTENGKYVGKLSLMK